MSSHPSQASFTLHALQEVPARKNHEKSEYRARKRQKHETLWYALWFPQLTQAHAQSLARQQQIAEALTSLSATVSIASADSFLFEVASSLNYFGGIKSIRARLSALLTPLLSQWQLPSNFHHAASPTPAASLLMARAECNLLIYRKENLRAALGRLPLNTLPLHKNKKRQFHNSGLSILRDVWRLPPAQLAQRFGYDFLKQLDQCLGHIASPVHNYNSPPQFSSALEWDFNIESKQALLPGIDELLERLCTFLQTRELAATHLCLSILHEYQDPTVLRLDLRQASRQHAHLMLLLETRLNTINLDAASIGMRLEVTHFQAVSLSNGALRGITATQEAGNDHDILPLLEELQARLGNEAVRSIHIRDAHCPEQAGNDTPIGENNSSHITSTVANTPRPVWLLASPMHLQQTQGRLFYHSSLQLLSGPERIETLWWTKQQLQRDYYIARNRQGMRLWIFHERADAQQASPQGWYLHGIFA